MAGIFDFFGGGGPAPTPGLLDAAGYMDPAQYDAARRSQGMMGLWAGLLQGGGPSLEPRNFGSALGAGLGGMNTFGNQFDESQLHASQAAAQRASVQKNLADIDIKKKGYQLAQDWLNKGEVPPGAAPVGGTGAVPDFGGGNTGRGGGGWGSHANTAIETARAAGASDAAIAGIMANGLGEGGFKNNWQKAWGDENSFGHWQFYEKGELPGYRAFVKQQGGDERDTRLQTLYALKRAEEVHPGFSKLTDPKLATDIFATKFEKYKGAAPGQRYGLLADAQRYMAGTPVEERQPIPAGPGGYTGAPAPGGAISQVPSYAGAFGGPGAPVPSVVAGGPPAPVPRVVAAPPGAPAAASITHDRFGLPAPIGYDFGGPGGQLRPIPAATSGSSMPRPFDGTLPTTAEEAGGGGDDMPASPYGSGVFSPAAQAAAAAAGPPVPAALVAPAPAVPPPPAAGAPPGAMPVPMPAAPPVPSAAAPGAAPVPGPMTVTLPAPPGQMPTTIPQAQPLPAAPETPAIPPRPQIPGVAPGAAVSPAVAARARQAQGVVLGLSMMGVHVPSFLEKEAGIEIAGRTAAAEAEARQPIELQNKTFEASLTAAQKRWDALNDQQKETLAFQRGLTKDQMNEMYKNIHEQYKTVLKLSTEPALQRAIGEQTLPTEISKIEKKEQAQADNTQTTMVIGGREVPMTVGQANRISRGEPPEAVLGRGVLELGKQYLTPEQQSRAQAGATKSVEYSFKRLEDADTAGGAASRNLQTMGQLAQAAERFKTGATAEIWLDVKRYARDAGLITGGDVPDGEIIRQGSTKLAVMGAPRQGALSNYERGLMSTINPQLVNSPEAFAQLIEIGARLDQYDMQVARIHNEVAEKNGGVPDYLAANRRIRELGPPISAAERGALERLQTKGAGGGGGAAAAPPATTTGAAPFRWDPAANNGAGDVVPNTGR